MCLYACNSAKVCISSSGERLNTNFYNPGVPLYSIPSSIISPSSDSWSVLLPISETHLIFPVHNCDLYFDFWRNLSNILSKYFVPTDVWNVLFIRISDSICPLDVDNIVLTLGCAHSEVSAIIFVSIKLTPFHHPIFIQLIGIHSLILSIPLF